VNTNRGYASAKDFLENLDAGELDGNLLTELEKLSTEQSLEVAQLLAERRRVKGTNTG
jgi:hypothetical protein